MRIYIARIINHTANHTIDWNSLSLIERKLKFGHKEINSILNMITDRLNNLKQHGIHRFPVLNYEDLHLWIRYNPSQSLILVTTTDLNYGYIRTLSSRLDLKSNSPSSILTEFNHDPHLFEDKLKSVQNKVDDLKSIMHQNIGQILNNDETLESLLDKVPKLEQGAKDFYKKAKKTNRCCRWPF
jgi:hypothetical protein